MLLYMCVCVYVYFYMRMFLSFIYTATTNAHTIRAGDTLKTHAQRVASSHYLDEPSSDSELLFQTAKNEKSQKASNHIQTAASKHFTFPFTSLQMSATEVICSILLEELQKSTYVNSYSSSPLQKSKRETTSTSAALPLRSKHASNAEPFISSSPSSSFELRQACVRAALRLVATAVDAVAEGEDGGGLHNESAETDRAIHAVPLAALGDTNVLETLVESVQVSDSFNQFIFICIYE